MDSSIFFDRPAVDPSVRDVEATVPFLRVVFIFAACYIVGLSATLPEGLGAAETSPAETSRAVAGWTSRLVSVATLFVPPVTPWFAVFFGILGLVAVRRFVPKLDHMCQRNV